MFLSLVSDLTLLMQIILGILDMLLSHLPVRNLMYTSYAGYTFTYA